MSAFEGLWSGAAGEDFRWRNAARFIGLNRTGKTRERLLRTIWRGQNSAALDQFDPN